jgi:hypothetical protein
MQELYILCLEGGLVSSKQGLEDGLRGSLADFVIK